MWEALTAIGTIASAIVIAVTVLMAARQVRLTADQLEQLRRATQFQGAMAIFQEQTSPVFWGGIRFVMTELKGHMKDDGFRSGVELVGMADDSVHKELIILRTFDNIGLYVKQRLIEPEVIYSSPVFVRAILGWEALQDVIAVHRQSLGPWMWGNFEYLYVECKRWAQRNGRTLDLASVVERLEASAGEEK